MDNKKEYVGLIKQTIIKFKLIDMKAETICLDAEHYELIKAEELFGYKVVKFYKNIILSEERFGTFLAIEK